MADAALNSPSITTARAARRRLTINHWATDISDLEIGIMPTTQHRAKSDQFTKDMDVLGDVREDGRRVGVVAYRMDPWRETTGMRRRLIFKLFSDTMNWRATMEMTVGRSLQLTMGAGGTPVTAYAVNLSRQEQIVQFERSADKWWFFPEKFSFFLDVDGAAQFYTLRQAMFSIGADYILYDGRGRRIGYIDGKLISVGGVWHVELLEQQQNTALADVLQLFCAMLKFNKSARSHIRRLAKDVAAGRVETSLDHHEKDLYSNPRRRR
ncbi:MAG: hypothetical protein AAFV62_10125 [Pseudomonadota bacterium]